MTMSQTKACSLKRMTFSRWCGFPLKTPPETNKQSQAYRKKQDFLTLHRFIWPGVKFPSMLAQNGISCPWSRVYTFSKRCALLFCHEAHAGFQRTSWSHSRFHCRYDLRPGGLNSFNVSNTPSLNSDIPSFPFCHHLQFQDVTPATRILNA